MRKPRTEPQDDVVRLRERVKQLETAATWILFASTLSAPATACSAADRDLAQLDGIAGSGGTTTGAAGAPDSTDEAGGSGSTGGTATTQPDASSGSGGTASTGDSGSDAGQANPCESCSCAYKPSFPCAPGDRYLMTRSVRLADPALKCRP